MSNPYLSIDNLMALESLADANQVMIMSPGVTPGYVALSDLRDSYMLTTVNEQIAELQSRPSGGSFTNPMTITFAGVVSGSVSFDGTENVTATLSMPDNSIPISAVEDLASTIASLESEIGSPNGLAASYFSNADATTQTTMMGYYNGLTPGLPGTADSTGLIFMLTSDGSLSVSASNYAHQLVMGNASTLIWRANVNNGGWNSYTLWHSGNFSPGNYAELSNAVTFNTVSVQANIDTTPALIYQDNVTSGGSFNDLVIRTGASGAFETFVFSPTGNFTVPNDLFATNIIITNSIGMGTDGGFEWNGGQSVLADTVNGGIVINMGPDGGRLLSLIGASGATVATWDSTGNYVSAAAFQAFSGVITGRLAVNGSGSGNGNGANNPTAAFQVNTSSGMIYVDELNGSSSIVAVNAANNAYTQMNLQASSFTFNGGNAAFSGTMGIGGVAAGTGGSGLAVNTGYGLLLARGISGTNYWDSANPANSAYQALQFNATAVTVAATFSATGLASFTDGISVSGALAAFSDAMHITGQPAPTNGQGGYIGWNYSSGQGEMDFVNNQGEGSGGFYWYNTDSTGDTVTNIMQLSGGGALTTTGVANFNTSDKRLKTNFKRIDPNPFHRKAPLYSFIRKDTGFYGESPLAQDIQKVNPQRVSEYLHMDTKARHHLKRLAVDYAGVALEQAYWNGEQIDEVQTKLVQQQKMIDKLLKRIGKLEAASKRRN